MAQHIPTRQVDPYARIIIQRRARKEQEFVTFVHAGQMQRPLTEYGTVDRGTETGR
jgi:hypothetical protein